jgi:hypothetical protein
MISQNLQMAVAVYPLLLNPEIVGIRGSSHPLPRFPAPAVVAFAYSLHSDSNAQIHIDVVYFSFIVDLV